MILLGPGNEKQAELALSAYPGGLQLGGGVNPQNAEAWLDKGASHVIATSALFDGDELSIDRVRELSTLVRRERLVIDLSCRKTERGYFVATNRWQTVTRAKIDRELLHRLADYADEFLIHAADVEGKCEGIDDELVILLGEISPIPTTYAGGARSIDDLTRVSKLSNSRVDLTIGSALDLFGGDLIRYTDCVAFNKKQKKTCPSRRMG